MKPGFIRISFMALAVVIAVLAVLTAGVSRGWPESLYTSLPVMALWTITAVSASAAFVRARLYRRAAVFGIHVAFLVILAGACVTHFSARSETVHMRVGAPGSGPCGLRLLSFETVTYPATSTPRDYRCLVADSAGHPSEVSLNSPGRLSGCKLVLDSRDSDGGGATFMVSRDAAGTGITFAGYLLLALSLAGYFLSPGTAWRRALRRMAVPAAVLAAMPLNAAVTEDFAREFGATVVSHNGRLCPMSALAKDFTTTVTGGPASYRGMDADMVLAGFVFDFSRWKREPVIKIKSAGLRRLLGISGCHVSYERFFEGVTSGAVNPDDPEQRRMFASDFDRFEAVNMAVTGEILKIFPVRDSAGAVDWFSPTDKMPAGLDVDRWLFIRKYLGLLNEQVQRGDVSRQRGLMEALLRYQEKTAGEALPSSRRLRLERLYVRMVSWRWPAPALAVAGALMFLSFAVGRCTGRIFRFACASVVSAALAALSAMIAMRWALSGHVPLSNGYETMQFLAWISLAFAVACARSGLLLSVGVLAGGLAMCVAVMGGSGASVTGLVPVLDSPLLSVHVLLVMVSYALSLFMALTGVAGLLGGAADSGRPAAMIEAMLYPALALLAAGIFVGAVWADVSWGRYWGWDPKEVWALITLLVYSFAAHGRLMPALRRPRALMCFAVAAFVTVLVTYFGVNFFLGGLHGYA